MNHSDLLITGDYKLNIWTDTFTGIMFCLFMLLFQILRVGPCELAICVRIEHESNWALRLEFKSNLESNWPYILLNTFHDGLTVAISIPPVQFVHCSSAGLQITNEIKEMCRTTDFSFQSSNTLNNESFDYDEQWAGTHN